MKLRTLGLSLAASMMTFACVDGPIDGEPPNSDNDGTRDVVSGSGGDRARPVTPSSGGASGRTTEPGGSENGTGGNGTGGESNPVDIGCDPGFQDNDGDGRCLPDCAQTAGDLSCGENAACDDSTGEATCVCDDGFQNGEMPGTCEPEDDCFKALGLSCRDFEVASLTAPASDPHDWFGRVVAMSGDTMVIGAQGTDRNLIDEDNPFIGNPGAIHVFVLEAGAWTHQALIMSPNLGHNNRFGASVAIDGDTIVAGSSWENGSTGGAYVFVREGNTWSEQAYLQASNGDDADHFATSVAVNGDTIAVGARNEDSGDSADPDDDSMTHAGAVYLFKRSNPADGGSTWSERAYIKAPSPSDAAYFGRSLSMDDERLVVGSTRGVSVFKLGGTEEAPTWTLEDTFSGSMASLHGDSLAIAESFENWVRVYVMEGSDWNLQETIVHNGPWDSSGWVRSVALDGDTLAVGVVDHSNATGINGDRNDTSVWNAGAVFVHRRSGDIWRELAYLKKPTAPKTDDHFGGDTISPNSAVFLHDDTLVLGTSGHQTASGAVYVRRLRPAP